MQNQQIIVVGAGIVGVSTALWLQRDGYDVLLLDREGPAAGTSYGNAGILASGSIVPVSVPGLLFKAPGMLISGNQPLFLKWSYLPRLLPFLRRYLKQAGNVNHIAASLHELLYDSVEQHHALADGTAAAKYLSDQDWLYGYEDEKAYRADRYGWDIRRQNGVPFRELSGRELAEHDPMLADRFGHGVLLPRHGGISDPGAYVSALMHQFCDQGGAFLKTTITDVQLEDGRCHSIETSEGPLSAETYVLALGAWSAPLARKLGVSVPLESERGYHIEYVNPSVQLKNPIMVASGKFVMHSMNGRLRCAGVVEFGGLDSPPSRAPFELLKRQVAELYPEMSFDRIDEWMGHRPSTPDSLPVIGKAPLADNVLLGYGHQHVGLTGGPKTGRWLAQLVGGRAPNTDLSAFSPNRENRP